MREKTIYEKIAEKYNTTPEEVRREMQIAIDAGFEDGESVMTAEYRPVEYGKDYDVVNNPDKFQLYIDGKEIK